MKLFWTLTILLLGGNLFAQHPADKAVSSKISTVRIFLDGAEVTETANLDLEQGLNQIVFSNISSRIDAASIRLKATSIVSVLSVNVKNNYLSKKEEKPKIKALKDSIEMLTEIIIAAEIDKNVYELEKQMVLSNQSIKGNNGVNADELKQNADFFRARLKELNTLIASSLKKSKSYNTSISRLELELNQLQSKSNYSRSDVIILLKAQTKIKTEAELSYLVFGAGWTPLYEVRAIDNTKPIELIYRAQAYNNSGIDWNNCNLILSTADPRKSITKPNLDPWYLDNSSSGRKSYGYTDKNKQQLTYQWGFGDGGFMSDSMKLNQYTQQKGKVQYREIFISELSAEFPIKEKYLIPSDARPYILEVDKYELAAKYRHYTVPKLDMNAYLLASVTGWENLNLVEGPAIVYFGDIYVGKSYLNPFSFSDTLDLSLGRDNKILISKNKLKEKSRRTVLGNKKVDIQTYELVVKNNRDVAADIEIQDQVPLARTNEVEIQVSEISDAIYNPETGLLSWRLNVKAGESVKVTVSYSIKYPSYMQIPTQKWRRMECPTF